MKTFVYVAGILFIVTLVAGDDEKAARRSVAPGRKRGASHFVPKTEHEKEVLKSVADRIYTLLNTGKATGDRPVRGPSDDSGDLLTSVLSMVLDREGRAPRVESDARVLETLTHLIADASEQIRKRQDSVDLSNIAPNVSPKLMEPVPKAAHTSDTPKNEEKKEPVVTKMGTDIVTSGVLKPIKARLGNSFVKTPIDGKLVPVANPKKMEAPVKDKSAAHTEVRAPVPKKDASEHESVAKVSKMDIPVKGTAGVDGDAKLVPAADVSTHEGVDNRVARDPVLKLTPHVVFTDSEGREYRLVGVGSRSGQGCTGQCLGVDAGSKDVLAYKKPTSAEFLVLADHSGEEYYTSGVQLCDEPSVSSKPSRHVRGSTNLALLTPHKRRDVSSHNPGGALSVTWSDEAKAHQVKREDMQSYEDFNRDVDALFSGPGLKEAPQKVSKLSPQELLDVVNGKNRNSRRKRQRHVGRLFRTRRQSKSEKIQPGARGEHVRKERDVNYFDYLDDVGEDEDLEESFDTEEKALRSAESDKMRTPFEVKVLEELKKDKKSLEEFSRSGKAKVDVDKCKSRCDAMAAGRKRSSDVLSGKLTTRTKRSSDFDLMPYGIDVSEPMGQDTSKAENSTCLECSDPTKLREFLSLEPVETLPQEDGFKIIAIEPDGPAGERDAGPPMLEEEINMIQPSTSPDEEDKVLFRSQSTQNGPLFENQTFREPESARRQELGGVEERGHEAADEAENAEESELPIKQPPKELGENSPNGSSQLSSNHDFNSSPLSNTPDLNLSPLSAKPDVNSQYSFPPLPPDLPTISPNWSPSFEVMHMNPPQNFPLEKEYLMPGSLPVPATLEPNTDDIVDSELEAKQDIDITPEREQGSQPEEPEWAPVPFDGAPVFEASSSGTTAAPPIATTPVYEEILHEKLDKSTSGEVGKQFAEAVLFRVQNSFKMKDILGVGLKFSPPVVLQNPPRQHAPNYSSALQILLKTLMLNVEKMAQEDVERRSCILLESELQDFLGKLLGLPSSRSLPDQYTANLGSSPSYDALTLRKNELLQLLKEYHHLPPKVQDQAAGVKSFIEAELNAIDKQEDTVKKGDRYRRLDGENIAHVGERPQEREESREKPMRVEEVAKKWIEHLNPFQGMDLTKLNPFLAKPFAEPQPFPKYLPTRGSSREGSKKHYKHITRDG